MTKIILVLTMAALLSTAAFASDANPKVRLQTSKGDIVIELYPAKAPVTVANFLRYVKEGHYDGTIFHRVIPGFMIQGGGMTADFKSVDGHDPISNEAGNGLGNSRGTVAMARTSEVNSATDQFFINLVDNTFLDHRDETPRGFGYAVFGRVVEGMDVVDAIASMPTGPAGPFRSDVPTETVKIVKATVVGD